MVDFLFTMQTSRDRIQSTSPGCRRTSDPSSQFCAVHPTFCSVFSFLSLCLTWVRSFRGALWSNADFSEVANVPLYLGPIPRGSSAVQIQLKMSRKTLEEKEDSKEAELDVPAAAA